MSVGSIIRDFVFTSWYCLGPFHCSFGQCPDHASFIEVERKKKRGKSSRTDLLKLPFLRQQQSKIIVCQNRRTESPRPIVSTTICVTSPQRMGATQCHNLPIIESHPAEDGSKMILFFAGVREAPVGRTQRDVAIGAARPPRNFGTLHFLECAHAGECPEVGVGYPGKFFCKKSEPCHRGEQNFREISRLIGSRKSRAALRPALAP